MTAADAEIVVIGGGHNALTCAAYLAEAGLQVLVVEAGAQLGGDTITEELTFPGWRHDSCSSAHVVVQSNPLIRDDELGLLARYGLQYIHTDPAVVMPLDEEAVVMHRDVDATADELARWSTADAAALRTMMADWRDCLAGQHARWSAGLPPTGDAGRRYEELRRRSAWDVVHDTFSHPVSRALMTWLAFATIQPPQRPGTGALPAAITGGRLQYGWATPVGGSSALPDALARHLADHDGTVVTSAQVARILIHAGRAVGVETTDGRRFTASVGVVSSAHLAHLPELLPTPVPAPLQQAAATWRPGLALFAVHVALRTDIRYRTADGATTAVAGALGTPAGLRRQVDGCYAGHAETDDPWLLLVSATAVDPARAPGGVLKLLTAAPSRLSDDRPWDDDATEAYAERLLTVARKRVIGLQSSDVLAVVPESPASLARRNPHNVGGSCHGGEFDLGDDGIVPGWPTHRTPIPGLYLTGATTHPGGSVSGRPGRNAARCVLEDLGIEPATVMPAH
ncbi:MAG: NAD(P)-binding protein [Streptosporangiales bacterium]|nr:NAD(P)-binding protein [Streptosporangiales bacterium]